MKWIKHDTDANQDAKLQNVLLDYGLEGYGLYWYCIELIAGKVDKDNITFDLEHDARIIARNTGSTAQKIEEMMRYFVKNDLFESCDGVITCLKLAKRLDKSMTSNPEMRGLIDSLRKNDGVMTQSEIDMQDKIRLEEIRLEEKRIKDLGFVNRFTKFWDLYAKKVDMKKCEAKFKKLTESEVDDIFLALPKYIQSTTDRTFRKNPLTWLNGKCWNDEVIAQSPTQRNINEIGTDFSAPEGFKPNVTTKWEGADE